MGVRINMYAVDVPPFEAFIDQSVGAALWHYVSNGSDRERVISWDDADSQQRYRAAPGSLTTIEKRGKRVTLTRERVAEEPFFQQRVRDYLGRESSYALLCLLRALSHCPPADFVREITTGHRRWWIGELLDYADQAPSISREDFARFVVLCQKVLRGCDCGKPLPERPFTVTDFRFPVIPKDDTDMWMGVWSDGETEFALDILRRIAEQQPRFKAPPGPVGIAPEAEEDWDKWVHEMIRQVLVIGGLKFRRLNVVTFIS
jgi:hypothetical protein